MGDNAIILTKKEQRKEKKRSKMQALLEIASLDKEIRLESSDLNSLSTETDSGLDDEYAHCVKKLKKNNGDSAPSPEKVKGVVDLTRTLSNDSIKEQDYKVLQSEVRKIKMRRKLPTLTLKIPGNQALLSTHVDERVPIFMTDVQHLLLNALMDDGCPYLPLRWCHLEKTKNIRHTIVLVIDNLSLYDYSTHESLMTNMERFQQAVEVVTPSLYKGSIIDELALVPLSDIEEKSLIEEYGSMDVAMESRKNIMLVLRAIFPIDAGIRPILPSDKIEDTFSRTRLLLSADQMIDELYPIPLRGKLRSLYADFIMTKDLYEPITATSPMYGLDCEMCRTDVGLELTRVSIIDEEFAVVYEKYVLPHNKIKDYLTRYSGITHATLLNVETRLEDVQKDIRNILPPNAILVGQSLNFDLIALKMMHPYVIDTSVIYNTTGNRHRKTKLKQLVKQFLNENIQNSNNGHCSVEDARACLKLVKLKLEKHLTFGDAILKQKIKSNVNYDHLKKAEHEYSINIFNEVIPVDKSCIVVGSEETVAGYSKYLSINFLNVHKSENRIKMIDTASNDETVDKVIDFYKNYSLTISHVKIDSESLVSENTYAGINKWIKNIWSRVEPNTFIVTLLSGNEICNGGAFFTIKR